MLDRSISVFGILTTSVPEFASAVFFSALFVFGLKWLPGTSSMSGGFEFKQLVLPAMVLIVYDLIMLQINWLLSGVIVVEFFFAYKGFGALILEASLNNDIALLEACAMVAVFVAVATQTIADIGYTLLNPRIRFS